MIFGIFTYIKGYWRGEAGVVGLTIILYWYSLQTRLWLLEHKFTHWDLIIPLHGGIDTNLIRVPDIQLHLAWFDPLVALADLGRPHTHTKKTMDKAIDTTPPTTRRGQHPNTYLLEYLLTIHNPDWGGILVKCCGWPNAPPITYLIDTLLPFYT